MRATLVAVLLTWVAVAPVLSQQGAAANETPWQFYVRYMKAVSAATTLEQLVTFWSNDQRQKFQEAADRPRLDEVQAFFKSVSGFKVLQGSTPMSPAIIEAEGTMTGQPAKATFRLTRENDEWKIASGPDQWR